MSNSPWLGDGLVPGASPQPHRALWSPLLPDEEPLSSFRRKDILWGSLFEQNDMLLTNRRLFVQFGHRGMTSSLLRHVVDLEDLTTITHRRTSARGCLLAASLPILAIGAGVLTSSERGFVHTMGIGILVGGIMVFLAALFAVGNHLLVSVPGMTTPMPTMASMFAGGAAPSFAGIAFPVDRAIGSDRIQGFIDEVLAAKGARRAPLNASARPTSHAPAPDGASADPSQRLARLADLVRAGHITESEAAERRREILREL